MPNKMKARNKMAKMMVKIRMVRKIKKMKKMGKMKKKKTRKTTAASQYIINRNIKNTAARSTFDHTSGCLAHGLTRNSLTCYAQRIS